MSEIVAVSPTLQDLVALDAQPEKIATGFVFTEGPVWDYRNDRLIFSDLFGETLYDWTRDTGHRVLEAQTDGTNGNTLDLQGRLISCQSKARHLTRTGLDGVNEVLVSHYDGKRINAPNDVFVGPDGDVFFTDTPYGVERDNDGEFVDRQVPFWAVFRYRPSDGTMTVLADDFDPPNGIVVSPSGDRLYVSDTGSHLVRTFELGADGRAVNGRVFCDLTHGEEIGRIADGMALDDLGNLYVAANTLHGLWVYNPAGDLLGLIGVGEEPSNVTFGGPDWTSLFVTARTSVYRIPMKIAGQRIGGG